jgi:hypothetical protein
MDVVIHDTKVPQGKGKSLLRFSYEIEEGLFEERLPQSRSIMVDFGGNMIGCPLYQGT